MKKSRSNSKPDFLDEMIAERSRRNAQYPRMLEAALDRRRLLRALADRREQLGLTQTAVADRMQTSQSAVARIEAGEIDAKLSTVERYAVAIGQRVQWRVVREEIPGTMSGKSKNKQSTRVLRARKERGKVVDARLKEIRKSKSRGSGARGYTREDLEALRDRRA